MTLFLDSGLSVDVTSVEETSVNVTSVNAIRGA
jgi:hypothetical protein